MLSKMIRIFDAFFLTLAGGCYQFVQQAKVASLSGSFLNDVKYTHNAIVIPQYEVFEITFRHKNDYGNPFFDVIIDFTCTSPTGKVIQVGGFYSGSSSGAGRHTASSQTDNGKTQQESGHSDKLDLSATGTADLWKVRFAPCELGKWKYNIVFKNVKGEIASGKGTFICVKGHKPNPGFVRRNPTNPFRFVFDNGSPYFPIGLQECWGDGSGNGSVLDECSMEGPFRTDLKDPPPLPPGPMFVRGPSGNPQNADVYFRYFSKCGFNLFRFSQQNCSYRLYQDLDHYLVREGIMTDELLCCVRKYGLRVFYGIFGFQEVFNNGPYDEENMLKVKRFIKYSVDRWGAYVDFWEFLNEQKAGDRWYEIMVPYLKSVDPYHHLVTTSWERPEIAGIEINAPHWYQREDEHESDVVTALRAKDWKRFNTPVVVGEQGNHIDKSKPQPPGVGGVWDESSALRMRIRTWTALFNEIAFIFWNTSYARDGHYMNIWLGPKEREYVRALQDFAYRLDKDVRMVPVSVSEPNSVRAYGLASKKRAGVYLHHFSDHSKALKNVKLTLDVPGGGKGYWYLPENAAVLGVVEVSAGVNTFEVPQFVEDIAFLITPDGPPDIDKDGRPNHLDPDDDQDGVPDREDAFPLEPHEWQDKDKDLIGDNLDADDDGDGVADDINENGIPDCEELDFDGDGVQRARSVPWDAFPLDPQEWQDTDGDGIGDNADLDDDNDGYEDDEEIKEGTDPLDRLSFPLV